MGKRGMRELETVFNVFEEGPEIGIACLLETRSALRDTKEPCDRSYGGKMNGTVLGLLNHATDVFVAVPAGSQGVLMLLWRNWI